MNVNDNSQMPSPEHESQSFLGGEALKQATKKLATDLQAKIDGPQKGVSTYCNVALNNLINKLETLDKTLPWEESVSNLSDNSAEELGLGLQRLQLFLYRSRQGRFVDFQDRVLGAPGNTHRHCDINYFDLIVSQGALDCMQWKGLALFKTVYDFSLYPMILWSLKPGTIIELGSGTGASAIWLADLSKMLGIQCSVYSVDLNKPNLKYENIDFIQGDCRAIGTVLKRDFLENARHPWMIIEDAHVNLYGVLSYFHSYIEKGDYVVIEDSEGKREDISKFLNEEPACYKVDTYYTDFFGRNATCARDSILVRV